MTEDDYEKLGVELCRMWPNKFQDSELADWCMRLTRYNVGDILRALNEFKNTSKFRPQVSEILARLKGKEQRQRDDDADPGAREGSWADVRRRQNPQWASCSDREVALRYWRSLWFRKKKLTGDRHLDGFRVHVTRGCMAALMGENGMSQSAAERCVAFVFEEDLGMAQLMLSDARQMNEQGEPVDVFA